MKQKMVVNVTMNGLKSRSKALKIAVSLSGVESASFKGDDKSQIEVIGDGVDPVQLTNLLRKSMGYAELVSLSAVDADADADAAACGEKEEKNVEELKPAPPYFWPYNPPYYYVYEVPYPHYHEPSCSIM